ncbi:MAG: DNA polymerase III subunit delta [Clostridia bacterium]|nr:DNA polymerase III subunit delta [Clostridia bacterium]
MPVLNESALKEKLKENPVGVYLIYGEESYLKKIYIDKIVAKTVDDSFADFNFHTFDGKDSTLSEIYECAEAVPMMAETKCVLVKDYPMDTLDDNGFEQLERLLSENPDDCALVFSLIAYEPKGAKFTKAVKLFDKYGFAVKLDRKTPAELIKMLENGAKKRGKPFAKGVAQYLITCVGSDLNTLLNETEKACAFAAGDEVLKSDVDSVCIKSLDAKVFDMIKDLTSGRFDSAFKKLSLLFEQREDEFQILGALIAQYSDIYRAKAAVKSGNRAEAVAKFYNYAGKEFRLSNAARNGSSLSFADIGECIEILSWADTTLKSSALDKRLVLEQTVVKLARVGRR